jgi:hypothetical protein
MRPEQSIRSGRAQSRRYMGDRRSPSPSGHITLDIRVILAHIFGLICGDDHPYITRSGRTTTRAATAASTTKPAELSGAGMRDYR